MNYLLIHLVAGLTGTKAFHMSVGYLALGWVCTCLSWIIISKYGRRRIYNIGLAVLAVIMFLIGILDCVPNYEDRPAIIWAQSTLMVHSPPIKRLSCSARITDSIFYLT